MKTFGPTKEELKEYRTKHTVGLLEAQNALTKLKMIKHLEEGGASEPVLLQLLRDWNKENPA